MASRRLYATAPWGVTDQPEFRNAVVALDVPAGPDPATGALALLVGLKDARAGCRPVRRRALGPARARPRPARLRPAPDRASSDRPKPARIEAETDPAKAARRLEVPHRDAGERLFVLAPLADLAPRLVPPGWGETVETRRRRVATTEPPDNLRVVGVWNSASEKWSPGLGADDTLDR